MNLQTFFTLIVNISAMATLIGLLLALIALKETRRQSLKLEAVANSLTTRYIGVHPDYMSKVKELVEGAQEYLLVMSSVAGFGIFSAVNEWDTLSASISKAQSERGIPVILLSGSDQSRRERIHLQFREAYRNWNEWAEKERNRDRLNAFCRRTS